MQGPRGRTGWQRSGRARGRRGDRAPDRRRGAHLDPGAAKRRGPRSSSIRHHRLSSTRQVSAAQKPATREAGVFYPTSGHHRRWLRKSHITAVQPHHPAETWLVHWFGGYGGGTQGQTRDVLLGKRSVHRRPEWARGGGTRGWPKSRLSNPGGTWGVASFFPSLIGSLSTIGRSLLADPQRPLL